MLYRFKSHPAPGYTKDGRLVTASDLNGLGSVRLRGQNRQEAATAGGSWGNSGGGGGGNGGFGAGTNYGPGDMGSSSGFGGQGGSSPNVDRYNPVRDRLDEGSVVEDWIPRDASGLDEMFRLMYHRDHIAGTIVDLIADLIWSDYDLVGVQDPAIKHVFEESMKSIDVVATMPDITREYLVLGRTISSMIFDKERGIFKDVVSHDPSFVRLTPIPVRGFDPMIDLLPSPALKDFMESMDPRAVDARSVLPEAFVQAVKMASGGMSGGGRQSYSPFTAPKGTRNSGHAPNFTGPGIPLDPINTLFIPRRVFNYDHIGTSFFTRLISFWALEKALINATMTSARRRSRSILHIKAGIDEKWEATAEEIDNIAQMFIQADEDPVGSVVVTRNGVDTSEVRDGANFYKWSDEWTLLTEGKLRALGANDALLTGDATYSNQETAKAFFMEKAQTLRNSLCQRIFYNRMFPLIARIHGFRKRTKAQLDHRIRIGGSGGLMPSNDLTLQNNGSDILTQRKALEIPESELIMPKLQWRKELLNNVDEKRLEIYQSLQEQGVPITLRNLTSAANINLDSQIADLDADAALRKKVARWKMEWEDEAGNVEQEAKLEFVRSLQNVTKSNLQRVLGSQESGSLGPLSKYLFWGPDGKIGNLRAQDLAAFLDKIQPDSNQVFILTDQMILGSHLNQHLHDPTSAEIAQYLLWRTHLCPQAPVLSEQAQGILAEYVKKSLDQYASHGDVYQLGIAARNELKAIAGVSSAKKKKASDKFEKTMDRTAKLASQKSRTPIDRLPNNSSILFSGRTK
jgi:hypothetical protein